MTIVLITAISILVLTGLAWLASRGLRVSVCPICIGVGGTWLWMIGARLAGFAIDATMLAVLIGGSVVGVAYQIEKRLPQGRSQLLCKTLCFPAGFAAAYAIVVEHWGLALTAGVLLALLSALFLLPHRFSRTDDESVGKLEKQMKECC